MLFVSSSVYAGNEAHVDGSASLTTDGEYAFGAIQYAKDPYLEDELQDPEPVTWADNSARLSHDIVAAGQKSMHGSPPADGTTGPGIGTGVAPLFDSYGVIRAGGSDANSAYVALGFSTDKWTMEAADTPDTGDKNALSYGFGVNGSSSNFEYMMSVDQETNSVAAIGIRFTSAF